MEPFNYFTERLSSENKPTMSFVSTCCRLLASHLRNFFTEEPELRQMISAMLSKLDKYDDCISNQTAIVCAVLDPRVKANFLTPESKPNLIAIMRRLVGDSEQTSSQERRNILQEWCNQSPPRDEVRLYMTSETEPEETDILEFWRTNSRKYPKLSKIASDLLCVQATSVSSERIFSGAGLIDTERRNRLLSENFRAIILNKSWITICYSLVSNNLVTKRNEVPISAPPKFVLETKPQFWRSQNSYWVVGGGSAGGEVPRIASFLINRQTDDIVARGNGQLTGIRARAFEYAHLLSAIDGCAY